MILILMLVSFYYVSAYLEPHQLTLIRSIMSNPQTPLTIRSKTQYILIKNYLPYAISSSHRFREKLKSKKYIINYAKDLHQYAIQGLVHSVRRYNSTSINLYPYAKKYIMGYLYYGVTELSPLKALTHHERYTKKIKIPPPNLSNDMWFYDKYSCPSEHSVLSYETMDLYYNINQLSSEEKLILIYRYDLITLKKKRTWTEVAKLMSCSTETLRKKVKTIKNKLAK
jgi:RNA polymerase sigma factor (sigma-70 family)